jgi:hypothetical protein
MDVKQIVREYLEKNGYDGLYSENGRCGCDFEDFMPCGFQDAFCEVGHKVEVSPEESEYGEKWVIKPGKRPEGGQE